jgi:hypothetical protein
VVSTARCDGIEVGSPVEAMTPLAQLHQYRHQGEQQQAAQDVAEYSPWADLNTATPRVAPNLANGA